MNFNYISKNKICSLNQNNSFRVESSIYHKKCKTSNGGICKRRKKEVNIMGQERTGGP